MARDTRSTGGAAPPTAAGVTLARTRRHVRLGRAGVWGAVAAGPLALAVWMLAPSAPPVVQAAEPDVSPRGKRGAAQDPAGYAEVWLAEWLRSSAEEGGSAQARRAQSMAPSVPLPEVQAGAQSVKSLRTTAVRSAQRGDGRWSVTVAAQFPDGVRYFAVPVVASRSGSSFAVSGSPGRVAAPVAARVPESAYGVQVPTDGELASAAAEFLSAYLAGAGQVERYLAPGVQLAVAHGAYERVEVEQVSATSEVAGEESVPADGTRARVLVRAEARDAAGRWPLAYELRMAARDGRWEVAALESGTAAGAAGGVRS